MEYLHVWNIAINSLDNKQDQPAKSRTKNWV